MGVGEKFTVDIIYTEKVDKILFFQYFTFLFIWNIERYEIITNNINFRLKLFYTLSLKNWV